MEYIYTPHYADQLLLQCIDARPAYARNPTVSIIFISFYNTHSDNATMVLSPAVRSSGANNVAHVPFKDTPPASTLTVHWCVPFIQQLALPLPRSLSRSPPPPPHMCQCLRLRRCIRLSVYARCSVTRHQVHACECTGAIERWKIL